MRLLFFATLVAALSSATHAAINFAPGHYYTSSGRDIVEYSGTGTVLGTLTIPAASADELRGLAFGPDGLLYATAVRGSGAAVLALNSSGTILQTYPMAVYAFGNISYGKLAVDGQHIYMAAQNQLTRFDIGVPGSGTFMYSNNQVFDVEILPSKNLLVASAYEVNEITPAGAFVRTIEPNAFTYTDIRGVEYDPATNKMFVTHLGHSGFFFQIMRIDGTTGALEESVGLNYADDLFITPTGTLLVGSRTQIPVIYTQGLDVIGALGATQRMFVTGFEVPEPTGIMGVLMCIAGVCAKRPNRNRRR
jgi:hypothetical protein